MILISNILDKETLDHHAKELIDFCKERRWKSSSLAWAPNLTQGVVGTCITTNTSEMLKQRIIDCIVEHVPTFEEINISHYIWQMNSGISVHNDNNYKFSATIYLNKEWHVNYGGLFVWKDKQIKEKWNAICPQFNYMVINDDATEHLVTIVSPLAPENRITIQIRGF